MSFFLWKGASWARVLSGGGSGWSSCEDKDKTYHEWIDGSPGVQCGEQGTLSMAVLDAPIILALCYDFVAVTSSLGSSFRLDLR